jgi:hypothetical protein
VALREQLIEVAFAHAAAEGKSEKMKLLYHYLAGDQFRRRIEATVKAFTALRNGLTRERNSMERIWNEREKQIERVLVNTAGMYGEVRGIVGSSVPPVPALELDSVAGQLDDMAADMVVERCSRRAVPPIRKTPVAARMPDQDRHTSTTRCARRPALVDHGRRTRPS